jgi:hypothetical protein
MEDVYSLAMKTFRESKDVNDPRHDRFIAKLGILSEFSIPTGNYTCRSVEDPTISKSIFIYWEGKLANLQLPHLY